VWKEGRQGAISFYGFLMIREQKIPQVSLSLESKKRHRPFGALFNCFVLLRIAAFIINGRRRRRFITTKEESQLKNKMKKDANKVWMMLGVFTLLYVSFGVLLIQYLR